MPYCSNSLLLVFRKDNSYIQNKGISVLITGEVFFPSKLPNNIVQRSHGRKHHSVLETDKDAFLYTVNNTSRRDAEWLQSPVLVVFSYSYFVYFFHDAFCLLEHIDDALVVLYIFETKSHALAVFEPFLSRLIASNEEIPC